MARMVSVPCLPHPGGCWLGQEFRHDPQRPDLNISLSCARGAPQGGLPRTTGRFFLHFGDLPRAGSAPAASPGMVLARGLQVSCLDVARANVGNRRRPGGRRQHSGLSGGSDRRRLDRRCQHHLARPRALPAFFCIAGSVGGQTAPLVSERSRFLLCHHGTVRESCPRGNPSSILSPEAMRPRPSAHGDQRRQANPRTQPGRSVRCGVQLSWVRTGGRNQVRLRPPVRVFSLQSVPIDPPRNSIHERHPALENPD